MDEEMKRQLREAGPTFGIARYVHLKCFAPFLMEIGGQRKVIQPDRIRYLTPEEVVGHYNDVHACDLCGEEFRQSDIGYISCWVTSPEELAVWLKLQYRAE